MDRGQRAEPEEERGIIKGDAGVNRRVRGTVAHDSFRVLCETRETTECKRVGVGRRLEEPWNQSLVLPSTCRLCVAIVPSLQWPHCPQL